MNTHSRGPERCSKGQRAAGRRARGRPVLTPRAGGRPALPRPGAARVWGEFGGEFGQCACRAAAADWISMAGGLLTY
eukprot:scaffold10279_cov57-Phaeocystis_antarctica.AAC.1